MRGVESAVLAAAVLLFASTAVAVVRVVRGPTDTDRIAGVYLLSTGGGATLAVLADVAGERAYRDAALVLVLLSCVLSAAFAARERRHGVATAAAEGPSATGGHDEAGGG
ncbi:hypothetical protein E9565_10335 [Blastococcus sp. KM273129]|nr:hypothetical protein [Blastococcus sp. KM273129]